MFTEQSLCCSAGRSKNDAQGTFSLPFLVKRNTHKHRGESLSGTAGWPVISLTIY